MNYPAIPTRISFLVLLAVIATGCGQRPAAITRAGSNAAEPEDPLLLVRQTLRKERDLNGCKAAVAQLNSYLGRPSAGRKPAPLTAHELEYLKQAGLSDVEIKEVGSDTFTALDAHYLDQCLLFADVIRTLDMPVGDDDATQIQRAELAFHWAMRHVAFATGIPYVVPPGHVVRRGWGGEAERALTVVAVFQQAGLDCCLITVGGRLCGVGAIVGNQVLAFNPRTGKPLPGPGGKGIATVAHVRNDPALVNSLLPEGVKVDDRTIAVIAAELMEAWAPRMRFLQAELGAATPVVLGIDPLARRERFAAAGEKLIDRNDPKDLLSPARLLAYSIPVRDGGLPAELGLRGIERFFPDITPWGLLPSLLNPESPDALQGIPGDRFRAHFAARFVNLLTAPHQARDLLLRGQYDEATKNLMETKENIDRATQRAATESDLHTQAAAWVEEMRSAYAAMLRAERQQSGDLASAKGRVDALMKSAESMVLTVEVAAADAMSAEITYQLAQCKHEHAEHTARPRRGETTARDSDEARQAWLSAAEWWGNYVDRFGNARWMSPARANHARGMRDLARQAAAAVK
jgi:hypothetical protein